MKMSCNYERTLHAARICAELSPPHDATIALVALRYGPHGRLRAPAAIAKELRA